MSKTVRMALDVGSLKEALAAELATLRRASRPAAQAGAQILYDAMRAKAPVSAAPHMFHGTHQVYGPFAPGNLRNAIYQAFSADNSAADKQTYHVSWNAKKAPYGFMVEFGTSSAAAKPFARPAIYENRERVKQAIAAKYIEEVEKG